MKTLLLDNTNWDLVLDAAGNIAVAQVPYARAQDVASALKLFLGELWYNTGKGIPYFQKILGKTPPTSIFEEYMVAAALTVPGVTRATCTIQSFENRTVTGQVAFETVDGTTGTVSI
jgi:hypothetical protein